MAWNLHEWGRKYRKEAYAAKRAELNRQALSEPVSKPKPSKSIPAINRKFGIERRYIGAVYRGLSELGADRGWHVAYGCWYEKERDRENALIAYRKGWQRANYEYRAINRE